MYLIKQTPADQRKLEMSFDCSAFQYQLPKVGPCLLNLAHIHVYILLGCSVGETCFSGEIQVSEPACFPIFHVG